MNIEGLTIHALTTELNQALTGGRIIKVLQPTRYLFLLKIRQPDLRFTEGDPVELLSEFFGTSSESIWKLQGEGERIITGH